ncbi:DUF2306 domain-containing protein [Pleionea sp. CnH1-48]|uniref:DUF2306 domain-containing protein n=1 Tax=Pleionea sp. CnH1-48 TaxID=2954494 RepID=UPI002098570D|nr:DUF2306 domain-containing protein [Pleionea sp. CnH1-48]MCO7222860.1 DUF2306 domain-containing protein [Pleionea sp. CnH1-48]
MTKSNTFSHLFHLEPAKKALTISAQSWLAIALVGQWAFALYIFMIYAVTLANGLDVNDFSPAPKLKSSEGFDRFLFFSHVIPAIYLSLFGLFQLVPQIRNRFKSFHRWNGRIFLILGFIGATTGLYLQWTGDRWQSVTASLGITLNGLLILVAVFFTWHYAIKKQINLHKRWAVHAFILVNGVWSFRLYLMGWYMVNQGPNGNTRNIDGPMDLFLSYACYLLPMAIAEVYFWANRQRSSGKVWGGTSVMTIGILITLIGVSAAVIMMWTPRISKVLGVL